MRAFESFLSAFESVLRAFEGFLDLLRRSSSFFESFFLELLNVRRLLRAFESFLRAFESVFESYWEILRDF